MAGSTVTQVAVFGAGGHGRVVAEIARALGIAVELFIDDAAKPGQVVSGLAVVTLEEFLGRMDRPDVALGVGGNSSRQVVMQRLLEAKVRLSTVTHPSAVVSPTASLGEGSVVMANAVINADARCGRGVIVNSGAVVEHDCELGDFAHVSPNAALAGGVRVGAFAHVGIGASVLPLVRIGERAVVGGGACVVRDVPDGMTVVGVPARVLRT